MCGTNPQDLVCFPPPHLPTALNSFQHLACLCCCTSFYSFFTFYFYVHIQLPPMTFFPLNCSLACVHFYQFPIHLYKPLLVLILLVTHCLLFSPCLLTYYLLPLSPSPCGDFSPCSTCPFLFSFSFSCFPPLILSPMVPQTQSHWQGPKVHLHLCSRLHWTISRVTALTLAEQRYYGNSVSAILSYCLYYSPLTDKVVWEDIMGLWCVLGHKRSPPGWPKTLVLLQTWAYFCLQMLQFSSTFYAD